MSRNPTPLFSSVTVKNFDKREISLIIEAEEIPQKIPLEILNMMLCFYWIVRYNLRMMDRLKKIRWTGSMKKPSLNVIHGTAWLKYLLVGTLQPFQK